MPGPTRVPTKVHDTKIMRKLAESDELDVEIERRRVRCETKLRRVREQVRAAMAEPEKTPEA